MALRAFKGVFLVAIDEDEAKQEEHRAEDAPPVFLGELSGYLKEAVRVDLDFEDHGNPCGVQSLEVLWPSMRELSEDERKELYG